MAVNQSHTEDRRGPVIPYGESLLEQCPGVHLSFPQQPQGSSLFSGTKSGTLFLTSYRVIFLTSHSVSDPMLSFMMPFDLMKSCTIEQPVFGANYIKGTIHAAPDGGWEGQATFKLVFRAGGAIHFAQLMMEAASAVIVYGAPSSAYGAPPPVYAAPPLGYGPPPTGYGAPPPGYGAPPIGYGAPPPIYGAPPIGYGAPPPIYGAPPPGYGAPPPSYEVQPVGLGAPSSRYQAAPAGNEAQPSGGEASPGPGVPGVVPAESGAGAPGSVAAQRPG
ncbi:postacrosomal sheath WW domain-binding protein isoform X3 [Oryctolagus cuniculus]|uniref:postacrosomal sheath WW domain-binding protein isoform X3 n=1 Tax=Oryctolagus cuniculus TaxID=9986 RepID=UPI00048BF082|nr:postacrosomal sheath WW domain-binding protein isoform X4 [Oryctolagus cuniculus]